MGLGVRCFGRHQKSMRSMRPSDPRGSPQAPQADPLESQTEKGGAWDRSLDGRQTHLYHRAAGPASLRRPATGSRRPPRGLPHSLPHPCRHMQVHMRNQWGSPNIIPCCHPPPGKQIGTARRKNRTLTDCEGGQLSPPQVWLVRFKPRNRYNL